MSVFLIEQSVEFRSWLKGLRDRRAQERISQRIARLGVGLLGDAKPVGEGVMELRIDHGPGYRLYFIRRGPIVILLLCGGDKGSQKRDIARAKALAAQVEDRTDGA